MITQTSLDLPPDLFKPKVLRKTRGRPKKHFSQEARQLPDLGTPELCLKRACRITAEPIDLCLERGIITPMQHRCALHLRWLHTIRYGAPSITALDLSRGEGTELVSDEDPLWRQHREAEYHEAISLLRQKRLDSLLLPLIIYNEPPHFLKLSPLNFQAISAARAARIAQDTSRLSEGLEALKELWKMPANSS